MDAIQINPGDNVVVALRPLAAGSEVEVPGVGCLRARDDGSVTTCNELWIIPTVGCVNEVARAMCEGAQDLVGGSLGASATSRTRLAARRRARTMRRRGRCLLRSRIIPTPLVCCSSRLGARTARTSRCLRSWGTTTLLACASSAVRTSLTSRSEERRVWKECRSRWSPYH